MVAERSSEAPSVRDGIPSLSIGGAVRQFRSTMVMGVVNASPESFSDAGQFTSLAARLDHAAGLVEAGADIIDVGGQSAITGRPELDPSLEQDRVLPIVEWLRREYPAVLVSVDTYKPAVARAVLAGGAHLLNDVSGLRYPEIAELCARHRAALVIMHTAAPPKVRLQRVDQYHDVAAEVASFLGARMEAAASLGLPVESVILDPGPDFAKTPHQTVTLLRQVDKVRALGRPLLLALSRKDFLGAITGRSPRGREAATSAAIAFFAARPGGIVRVHDVAAAVDAIATVEVLSGLRDIPMEYSLPDEIRHEAPGG